MKSVAVDDRPRRISGRIDQQRSVPVATNFPMRAVERISQERMTDRGEMDTDLMKPAGQRSGFDH